MNRADSLPAALFRRAEATPEEPWLFYQRGWDWSWLPWRAVAERVTVWIESLSQFPAGTRAALAAAPSPATIALDLALQGAGLVSVPLVPELAGEALAATLAERGAEVWVETEGWDRSDTLTIKRVGWGSSPLGGGGLEKGGGQEGGGGNGVGEAPHLASPLIQPPPPQGGGTHRPAPSPGGAVVDGGRALTAEDLIAAAAAIEALLPAARRGREILVSCRPLSDPAERQLLAWATWSGAALLLEPDRSAGAATAVWVRPTLFHGTAAEIAVLRRAVERQRFRRRLPFGRLHTLLVDGALPETERSFWTERGVQVAALPA